MALQQITGQGLHWPPLALVLATSGFSASGVLNATGNKVAFNGRVWFSARTGTKNISRVQFRFGTVTKAGGSALTVSMQDVSLTAGPPIQPDGTQDQTVAIANADAGMVSNGWYRTAAFSGTRTVSNGDLLSVVFEFDGSGRLGADSIIIATGPGASTAISFGLQSITSLFSSGSWAVLGNQIPVLVLEFDDGSYGMLDGSIVNSNFNSVTTLNTGSTPDEIACAFKVPFPCKIDALYAQTFAAADFSVVLYSGTTALETIAVDGNAVYDAGAIHTVLLPLAAERTLTVGTQYYVSLLPTTASNIRAYSMDVNDANFMPLMGGSADIAYSTRTDAGAWAAITATRRLYAGVRISSLDDGISGIVRTNMAGGLL